MYTRQEENKIVLYQSIINEDINKKLLYGSKQEIQELILLLQKSIKDYKHQITL